MRPRPAPWKSLASASLGSQRHSDPKFQLLFTGFHFEWLFCYSHTSCVAWQTQMSLADWRFPGQSTPSDQKHLAGGTVWPPVSPCTPTRGGSPRLFVSCRSSCTDDHTLGGLKQQEFILSQLVETQGLKGCQQGPVSSDGSGGQSSLPASDGSWRSWLVEA